MTPEQLNRIISQTQLGIERDEAEAKQRMAAAAEKRELLCVIADMQKQIEQLQADQHVHNTYHIEQLNGNYIETINNAQLCQPLSTTFTEPMSSTSKTTSKINITSLLNPKK